MLFKHNLPVRILAILSLFGCLDAATVPTQLKWSQLRGAVSGQKVIVDLKDNSHVNAVVTSVEESALALQVTSNSHASYKKGQAAIPRENVAGLRVIHMHVRGRIIGTSVGAVAGAAGAVGIGIADSLGHVCIFSSSCPPPNPGLGVLAVAVAVGVPVAGYFAGRSFDREEIAIVLLPD